MFEQLDHSINVVGELVHARQVLVVKYERLPPQLAARALLDASATDAVEQHVAGDAQQPAGRGVVDGPVAAVHRQHGTREHLAGHVGGRVAVTHAAYDVGQHDRVVPLEEHAVRVGFARAPHQTPDALPAGVVDLTEQAHTVGRSKASFGAAGERIRAPVEPDRARVSTPARDEHTAITDARDQPRSGRVDAGLTGGGGVTQPRGQAGR